MNKTINVIAALAVMNAGALPQAQNAGVNSEITAEDLAAHVKILASDEFEGRAPATDGETKTIHYLADHFRSFGAAPVVDGGYFQPVPMVEITAEDISPLRISGGNSDVLLKYGAEMVVWTKRVIEDVALKASDLVFVGYGIHAPEYEWNDYDKLDVRGKSVVILVNDPGFATGDAELFHGKAMTYYGRWTYKYEEAARQGAVGAIIIHQTEPAAYPWGVVESSWTGPQLDLERPDGNEDRALVEGWVSEAGARLLFEAAGLDLNAALKSAQKRGFQPRALDLQASVRFRNRIRKSNSHNVVGIVNGTEHPDEAVLYIAHWDHLGRGVPDAEGDDIYNGAVDNATGTAALIEIGRQFAANPPKRSIVLLATTGEESGLLGSAYYAENPIVPVSKTVGGLNMDALSTIGPVKDIVVVGFGKSELEDVLRRHAGNQDRVVVPEPAPERGYFYRSDHFSLAKVGVPMLYAEGGFDHIEKGPEWGKARADEYIANRYHQPSDEYRDDWDLRGAVQDARLLYAVGRDLANGNAWPNWYKDAEFRAARDESLRK